MMYADVILYILCYDGDDDDYTRTMNYAQQTNAVWMHRTMEWIAK